MSDFDPDYWGARIRAAAQVVPKGEVVMGEKMTLRDVLDEMDRCLPKSGRVKDWIAAIDAHLTQPAQAVDVGAIREVIADMRNQTEVWDSDVKRWTDKLTAALPKDSNGAEGADCWRLIATAPKDGKEVLVAFTADGVRQVAEASWSDDDDAWVCSRDGFMLYRRNEPTHWMPLPDAPQEDTPDAAR